MTNLKKKFNSLAVRAIRKTIRTAQINIWRMWAPSTPILVVGNDYSGQELFELNQGINFYLPGTDISTLRIKSSFRFINLFTAEIILVDKNLSKLKHKLFEQFPNVFFISKDSPFAAWEWVRSSSRYFSHVPDLESSYEKFNTVIQRLRGLNLEKAYIFGTGPSLSFAEGGNFEDGYVVVCNTIVKDRDLFNKLKPDFLVAGDGLYHFSFTQYAKQFRRDLHSRMSETEAVFLYPDMFDVIVQREFAEFSDRLIPVPGGTHQDISVDLSRNFELPAVGNVLPLLQLPVACTLAKNIYFWGFDGKAPDDQINPFWANSEKHSYPELMQSLRESFPGFYEYYVPNNDSSNYIKSVQGDDLDAQLSIAEANGFKFEMLHHSWTPTLNKRFSG